MSPGQALLVQAPATLRLIRLNSGITSSTAAVLTSWMASPPVPALGMALIAVVTLLLSSGGYALNDVRDRHIDTINQPRRPIPSDRIGIPPAIFIGITCLLAAALLALKLTPWCIGVTLLDIFLLIAYALWSKALGAMKNVVVGYLVASGFMIGVFTFDRIDPVIATLIACAFFATMGREIVKDIQDSEGDRQHHSRTLAITLGPRRAYAAAFICLALSLSIAAIPYAIGLVNDFYLALLLIGFAVFLLAWQVRQSSARLCQYMIMAGSLVVLAAFAIGSL